MPLLISAACTTEPFFATYMTATAESRNFTGLYYIVQEAESFVNY